MALKFTVDTLDGVDEAHRSLYQEKDGKFTLAVDGVVPTEKLNEFRTNNVALMKERDDLLAKFRDVDPEKYREFAEAARKVREKELIDAGQVDQLIAERVAGMKSEHDKQLKAVAGERDTIKSQMEGLVIDGALRDAAVKAGVAPTAVDDVLLRGRASFRLVDGKAVAFEGDKQLYGKDSEPLSVAEWVGTLAERAPHLFPPSAGGGAPKGGAGGGSGGTKTMTRAQFDALDPMAKAKVVKDTKIVD